METFTCRYCDTTFTKKSNLKRHILRKHDTKSIHHHGLQYVDKLYIKRETYCFLHEGKIKSGKMFFCLACNFAICADCMEEDCGYCNRNICTHKYIHIIINWSLKVSQNKNFKRNSDWRILSKRIPYEMISWEFKMSTFVTHHTTCFSETHYETIFTFDEEGKFVRTATVYHNTDLTSESRHEFVLHIMEWALYDEHRGKA